MTAERKPTLRNLLIEALTSSDAAPDVEDAENIADDIMDAPAWQRLVEAIREGSDE